MKSTEKEDRFLDSWYFLHIPKTAGTSVYSWLHGAYRGKIFDKGLWSLLLGCDKTEAQAYDLYCGHFYTYLDEYLGKPLRTFTFLRNPIDRAFSHYRHILRDPDHYFHDRTIRLGSFENWLRDTVVQTLVKNFHVRALSSRFRPWEIKKSAKAKTQSRYWLEQHIETADDGLSDEERLFIAKTQLLRFETFGITERMLDSQRLVSHALGIDASTAIPFLNEDQVTPGMPISAGAWQIAAQLLRDDLDLYEFALRLFDERVAAEARKSEIERAVHDSQAHLGTVSQRLATAEATIIQREAALDDRDSEISKRIANLAKCEAQLASTERAVHDSHVKIGALQQRLAITEALVIERDAKLAENDVKLSEQEVLLSEQKAKLSELAAGLSERDANVARYAAQLAESERTANNNRMEIDALREKNSAMEALVVERDAKLVNQDAVLAEQGKKFAELETVLAERNASITKYQDRFAMIEIALSESHAQIAALRKALAIAESLAIERDAALAEHNVAILQLRHHAETLHKQLDAVYASRSWRLTAPARATLKYLRNPRSQNS